MLHENLPKNDQIQKLKRMADRTYEFGCHKDAFKLYKAIERITKDEGHVSFRLGVMYYNGWGTVKDETKATMYFALAVPQLSSQATSETLCDLGYIFENGYGCTEKNPTLGFQYYQQSADLGFPRGQFNCGYMHHYGNGTPTDHAMALHYYQLASEAGYPLGQYNLGHMYQYGSGVQSDIKMALKYYKMSADQGYPRAQYILGLLYATEHSMEDVAMEIKFYSLAAESGHERAGIELARIYEEGKKSYTRSKKGSSLSSNIIKFY